MRLSQLLRQPLKKASLRGAFFYVLLFSGALNAVCLVPEQGQLQPHSLEKIYDGDTVHTVGGEKVRLVGFNTPEVGRGQRPAEPLAKRATQRLRALLGVPPKIVLKGATEQRDRYGRVLAYGFTPQGEDIAATLIEEGLAFAIVVPPNLWNSDCYVGAQQQAREAGHGVWGHSAYQPQPLGQIHHGGFQRIRGRVKRVDWSNEWLWLDMEQDVSAQIKHSDLPYFEGQLDLEALQGKVITLQGWLVPRKRGYRLRLRHPSAIKVE